MPYRDENGHFISEEEARRRGLIEGDVEEVTGEDEGEEFAPSPTWADRATQPAQVVYVETGRGQAAEVQAGAPFVETVERLADEAHYGRFFRVFLNGDEIINPDDAPQTIEPDMRIAITSYDKVG